VATQEYIERLQVLIHDLHGTHSKWLKSIYVFESYQGKTVWEGDVELFELTNHPTAKRCYAWSNQDPESQPMTPVLELPPVNNASDAVKVYIVTQQNKGKPLALPGEPI
jgi:hypothetical protein